MSETVTLDVTTLAETVSVTTTDGGVVQIAVMAEKGDSATIAVGTTTTGAAGTNASVVNSGTTSAAVFDFTIPRGATGEAGPNAVTSATTSDGTANLSVEYITSSTGVATSGNDAGIGTQGAESIIFTLGAAADIRTESATASIRSTNFAAYASTGASLKTSAGTSIATFGVSGQNFTFVSGTALTFDNTSFAYGTGAAAAHRTALGLGTLATQSGTFSGTSSGTNTGDQTTIVGITGTTAQFNTSLTDGDFATLAGSETLTNKTLTSPTLTTAIAQGAGTTTGTAFRVVDSANANRVTFLDNGNVGVGTAAPSPNAFWTGGKVIQISDTTGNLPNLRFTSTGVDFTFACDNGSAYFYLATNAPQRFYTNATERMRIASSGEIGVGTTSPSTKAILDCTSTTKGFLPPRMTTTQRDTITSPPAGLMIYNTTTNKLNLYTTAWEAVTSV